MAYFFKGGEKLTYIFLDGKYGMINLNSLVIGFWAVVFFFMSFFLQ